MRFLRMLLKAIAAVAMLTALAVGALLAYYLVILPPAVPVPDISVERVAS